MKSRYDEKSWPEAIKRMEKWVAPSVIQNPLPSPIPPPSDPPDPKLSSYLASINLNGRNSWPFELKTFPRPKGAATRVIITEYDLPGNLSLPHDVAVGQRGFVWYNDFQRALFGRLNPINGATKEWPLPFERPGYPEGLLSIKIDKEGNAWIPRFFQGCSLVKMDTKTEQMTTWKVPDEFNGLQSRCGHVALGAPDGTVWMSDSGGRKMFKLGISTRTIPSPVMSQTKRQRPLRPREENLKGTGRMGSAWTLPETATSRTLREARSAGWMRRPER
jgi:hypothetical protein